MRVDVQGVKSMVPVHVLAVKRRRPTSGDQRFDPAVVQFSVKHLLKPLDCSLQSEALFDDLRAPKCALGVLPASTKLYSALMRSALQYLCTSSVTNVVQSVGPLCHCLPESLILSSGTNIVQSVGPLCHCLPESLPWTCAERSDLLT